MSLASRVASALLIGLALAPVHAQTADRMAKPDGQWLMMVGTNPTSPAQEAEFNDWYDRIDVPDVLKVPGYLRARRGLRMSRDGNAALPPDEGRYVALYDIGSANIDKTIIEMLMASWGMEKAHQSTSALHVVERDYYQEFSNYYQAPPPSHEEKRFLYLERPICCGSPAEEKEFNAWYDKEYLSAARSVSGMVGIKRYKLYRVLMTEPKTVARYLTVYELTAASAEEALSHLSEAAAGTGKRWKMHGRDEADGSALYTLIGDVRRP